MDPKIPFKAMTFYIVVSLIVPSPPRTTSFVGLITFYAINQIITVQCPLNIFMVPAYWLSPWTGNNGYWYLLLIPLVSWMALKLYLVSPKATSSTIIVILFDYSGFGANQTLASKQDVTIDIITGLQCLWLSSHHKNYNNYQKLQSLI